MRLLLASMPTKPPPGQTSVPTASISTVSNTEDQIVQVIYADKSKADIKPETMSVQELITKVRENEKEGD